MPKGKQGFQKGHSIWLGKKHTQEALDKMSKKLKGKIVSEESRKKISDTHKKLGTKPPSRKGVKSSPETIAKFKKTVKERNSFNGKVVSQETRDKISKTLTGRKIPESVIEKHKGKKPSEETRQKMRNAALGRKASEKAKMNMSIARSGSGSSFWKGGKTALVLSIRNCFKYRQWRSDVYTRDDFTCRECGVKGGNLEAHHIYRLADLLDDNNIKTFEDALTCEQIWNINNGITMCCSCHKKTDNYGRRKK